MWHTLCGCIFLVLAIASCTHAFSDDISGFQGKRDPISFPHGILPQPDPKDEVKICTKSDNHDDYKRHKRSIDVYDDMDYQESRDRHDMLEEHLEKKIHALRKKRSLVEDVFQQPTLKTKEYKKAKRALRQLKNKRRKNKAKTVVYPKAYAMDFDAPEYMKTHPNKNFRKGAASLVCDCSKVGKVPKTMAKSKVMFMGINSKFYKKYISCYGIPIIGSASVTDIGLRRACYVAKNLLGCRYDLRNAMYKLFARLALIADNEEITNLPEYITWDAIFWNARVRGLGATIDCPMTSGGDDNQRCKINDRYHDQDVSLHELIHGIYHLGAKYVVPNFELRLGAAFAKNVLAKRKFAGKYAAENMHEYLAVCAQFFFNSFRGDVYEKLGVVDRTTLKKYDPDIYKLLLELFPCFDGKTNIINRCQFRMCDDDTFHLKYDTTVKAKSYCPEILRTDKKSPEECAKTACWYEGNAFNFNNGDCSILNCPVSEQGYIDLQIKQMSGVANIYEGKLNKLPKLDLKQESEAQIKTLCNQGPTPDQCNIATSQRRPCGDKTVKPSSCPRMGCCWCDLTKTCYLPKQTFADENMHCLVLAGEGECDRNCNYMYKHCPMSCGITNKEDYDLDTMADSCQDKVIHCRDWKEMGMCAKDAHYREECGISCGGCKAKCPPPKLVNKK